MKTNMLKILVVVLGSLCVSSMNAAPEAPEYDEAAMAKVKAAKKAQKEAQQAKESAQAKVEAEKHSSDAQHKEIRAANVEAAKIVVNFSAQRFNADNTAREKARYDALYKKGMTWYTDEDLADAVTQLSFDLDTLSQPGVDKGSVPGVAIAQASIAARVSLLSAEVAKRAELDKSISGKARRISAKTARAVRKGAESEFGQAVIGFGERWALEEAAKSGKVNTTLLNIIAEQRGQKGFDADAISDKEQARRAQKAKEELQAAQAAEDKMAADLAAALKEAGFTKEEADAIYADEEDNW